MEEPVLSIIGTLKKGKKPVGLGTVDHLSSNPIVYHDYRNLFACFDDLSDCQIDHPD